MSLFQGNKKMSLFQVSSKAGEISSKTGFKLVIISLMLLSLHTVTAATQEEMLARATDLIQQKEFTKAEVLLLDLEKTATPTLTGSVQAKLAELYMGMGVAVEDKEAEKELIKSYFSQAETYAGKAVSLEPEKAEVYYIHAEVISAKVSTVGPFEALSLLADVKELLEKALTLEPLYVEAYNFLALFYAVLPGWPISFGNKSIAVSFSRYAIQLMEEPGAKSIPEDVEMLPWVSLATALEGRNWDADKRFREQKKMLSKYQKAKTPLERSENFEGTVTLEAISDREEAAIIRELKNIPVSGASSTY